MWLPAQHCSRVCDCWAKYVIAGLISGSRSGSNPGRGVKLDQVNSGMYAIFLLSFTAYSAVALLCPQCATSRHKQLPSSRQMQGQGLPPLREARCGQVFLTVASNLEAAPGSPQRQHGGGPRGELRAVCPKSRKRPSVTWWERGWYPVVALTSTFVTWQVYGILRILHSAHMYTDPIAYMWKCYRINIGQSQPAVTKQHKFDTSVSWEGLASHWPCVTDNNRITTYRLMALGKEMSILPMLQWLALAHCSCYVQYAFTCLPQNEYY